MNRTRVNIFSMTVLIMLVSCSTVPLTGRKQLRMIPSDTMLATSFQQYDEFINTNDLSSRQNDVQMVERVGLRIQSAVETYMEDNKMSAMLRGYDWEFNLVDSEEVNAWCMPGGKVVIYTGILDVTMSETGLAVVMGQEIAHAIARHGNERMSQIMLAQMGGMALQTALEEKPAETQMLWMQAFGIGANLGVLLPFSRLHESEADHLGLIFMAMAGYDPSEAVDFWERMSTLKGGAAPPEFLSTHPSDDTRISGIMEILPEALEYYEQSEKADNN
ncbi:MAG: M48 family metallopeptidase [FCB group bacterium]|nr:M48 family metallopeptidase [FCB group bacterium]